MRQNVSLVAQSNVAVTDARVISSSSRSLRAVRSATDSIRCDISPKCGDKLARGCRMCAPPRGAAAPLNLGRQQIGHMSQRQPIAVDAKTGNDAGRRQRDIGMVAEGFALVDVGDVHFENWKFAGLQRIHDRDRGMRERRRIDDDTSDGLPRLVNSIDELMFGVALLESQRETQFAGKRPALRLHIREGLVTANMRVTYAEQAQSWPVEDQNSRSHCQSPAGGIGAIVPRRRASWQLAQRNRRSAPHAQSGRMRASCQGRRDRQTWRMPEEAIIGALLFLLLLLSSALGLFLQGKLHERHRSRETIDAIRLVISILVTFTALLLGLLTSSAKIAFDDYGNRLRAYGIDIIELDQRMREYGDGIEATRAR